MIFDDGTTRFEDRPDHIKVDTKTKETMQEMHLLNAHNTYTGTFLGRLMTDSVIISGDAYIKSVIADQIYTESLSAKSGTITNTTINSPTINNPKILIDGQSFGDLHGGDYDDLLNQVFAVTKKRTSFKSLVVHTSDHDGFISFKHSGRYPLLSVGQDEYMIFAEPSNGLLTTLSIHISGDLVNDIENCTGELSTYKDCCPCDSCRCEPTLLTRQIHFNTVSLERTDVAIGSQSNEMYIDYDYVYVKTPALSVDGEYTDGIISLSQGGNTYLSVDISKLNKISTLEEHVLSIDDNVDSLCVCIKSLDHNIESISSDINGILNNQLCSITGRISYDEYIIDSNTSKINDINNEINTIDEKIENVISSHVVPVENELSTKSTVYITKNDYKSGEYSRELSVGYISYEEYQQKIINKTISPNAIYLVSSDTFPVYDQRVTYMQDPIDDTDGVNYRTLKTHIFDQMYLRDTNGSGDVFKIRVTNGLLCIDNVQQMMNAIL